MRLTGRRESSNVDDRRGRSAGKTAGGVGIGGLIIAALVTWFMGGNPLSVLQNADVGSIIAGGAGGASDYQPTAEEEELATFARQILASTEDIWTAEFKRNGMTYEPPTLVLFTGSVQSGCGGASASCGPFYCSADKSVYLDLSFFQEMKKSYGAEGDFAQAYVIAHEVGHHVQNLRGILGRAHQKMSQVSQTESNQISVRLELQADYYAGAWACNENKTYKSLEDGDVDEGLHTASVIGDDYLQKKAQGYAVPETFNHGRSDQRASWLKRGLQTGTLNGADDVFSKDYDAL